MRVIIKVVTESVIMAVQQLLANKLRSFLSLMGITIGIFCIICAKSAVNSLEDNIRSSFDKLGNDVVYISKMPWGEDPQENYWKYMRRPNPNYQDFEAIKKRVDIAELVTYSVFVGVKTIKYNTNTLEGAFVLAVTQDYSDLFKIEYAKGRYFSSAEYNLGSPVCVIGNTVADEVFGTLDPVGREIKMFGRKFRVTGVIKKSGKDLINPVDFDQAVLISYEMAKHVINVKPNQPWGTSLNVKASAGHTIEELKDDLTWVLRARHHQKASEKDDFSLNTMTIIAGLLDAVFKVMNVAGFIIGILAWIVGVVSVANIMFVSVKERTNIIGIKKAIGAKNYMIMLEFLIESIILCIIGGIAGLFFVWLGVKALTAAFEFEMTLSFMNMFWGVLGSVVAGVLAGFIPAWQAARMDPVEAIRQG